MGKLTFQDVLFWGFWEAAFDWFLTQLQSLFLKGVQIWQILYFVKFPHPHPMLFPWLFP